MDEEHRQAIQTNFTSLVEQTDLDNMVTSLYEKGVFSEAMIEPYKNSSKDSRSRKRQLYRDIERRGPKAFSLLIETLTELGYWDLVRALYPDSVFNRCMPRNREPELISIKEDKSQAEQQRATAASVMYNSQASREEIPKFNVVKSKTFIETTPSGIPVYKTRTNKRGLLLAFCFIEFKNNIESIRHGADVDCKNLKYLFNEIGFNRIVFYNSLTKPEMENTIKRINMMVSKGEFECVFIVVSSHGYENLNRNDTDIRCSDGGLISSEYFIDHFNNRNMPQLQGVPKVFIFQMCRGDSQDHLIPLPHAPETDGAAPQTDGGRLYSDILVANSTLPGFPSHRDRDSGSWYIQSLCEVFAARAHDCHVEDLFKLVDIHMKQHRRPQTSSVDNRGFNGQLYLHPGLFQNDNS